MATASVENNAKRLARLAAVQGLYQHMLAHVPIDKVVKHFTDNPAGFLEEMGTDVAAAPVDRELFSEIVRGVVKSTDELDGMIAGAWGAKASSERVEALLRAILRAGTFELHHHAKIPAGVIINDYVDVAHAFFDAKEPGLVNGILDKLAKKLRG